jgi:hypothetical protein
LADPATFHPKEFNVPYNFGLWRSARRSDWEGKKPMNSRHPFFCVLAILICVQLVIPADVAAQATQPQHAGKITALLPVVNVIRGPQQTPASTSEEVFWGDVINTGHLARARVALDDGSVLSVGSDSNLTVTKHDGGAQQTDLELNYGRVRAKAVKLVKPKASFQIRTPTGVAGVVGTDFALDSQGDTTRIVVFEGKVSFCSLHNGVIGSCVTVGSGESSSVQFNSAPAAVAVAAVVVRAASKTPTCPTTAATAAHVVPEASCAARSRAATGKAPGQRP